VSAAHPNPAAPSAAAEPRCPACGEPMYGWVVVGASDPSLGASYVIDRCEQCGLGLTRDVPGDDAPFEGARSRLEEAGTAEIRAPNRASLQAGIGGDQWAALELPAQRLHLTPRSLELLLERHGLEAARMRQPLLGRNQLWMWQTLLNGFTFHTNFARRVLSGRLRPRTARSRTAFAVDAVVSTLAALPIALVSVPLELISALARRGGELVVSVTRAASRSAS